MAELTIQPPVVSRKVVWGSSIAKDPPTVTYEEAMTDQGLFKWLSKVVSHRCIPSGRGSEFLTLFVRISLGSVSYLVSLSPLKTPRSSRRG